MSLTTRWPTIWRRQHWAIANDVIVILCIFVGVINWCTRNFLSVIDQRRLTWFIRQHRLTAWCIAGCIVWTVQWVSTEDPVTAASARDMIGVGSGRQTDEAIICRCPSFDPSRPLHITSRMSSLQYLQNSYSIIDFYATACGCCHQERVSCWANN